MKQASRVRHLLIVNYHEDSNRAMARLLRMSGYEVSTATSLTEAGQVLSARVIDLMVCRVTASDGDGAEFIERVWNERRVPSIAFAGDPSSRARAARLTPRAVRGVLGIPIDLPTMLQATGGALTDSGHRVGVCDDCQGKGEVLLFTSTRPCRTCGRTGLAREHFADRP